MSQIIYHPPRSDEGYLINEDAQRLLGYFYLYGSAHPNEIADWLNYETEKEVVETSILENSRTVIPIQYGGLVGSATG